MNYFQSVTINGQLVLPFKKLTYKTLILGYNHKFLTLSNIYNHLKVKKYC